MTIDRLTRKDFTELPPASLLIRFADGDLPINVIDSRELPGPSPRGEPFAVTLAGPQEPLLPQGMYAFIHPQLGQLDLFMVPVARNKERCEYELTFN